MVADDRHAKLPGIIVFILADIASFVLFFIVFMAERAKQLDVFVQSGQHVNVTLGLINTLILITSGCLVALAVPSARNGQIILARRFILGALAVGALFAVIKGVEYYQKIQAGLLVDTNLYFTFYYIFTGLHFVHYVVGMTLLTLVYFKLKHQSSGHFLWLHSGALYWHMVDLLWIFIFPLLYFQGAR